uniref:Uncharacterized protein n=1 Tax=Mycena chlorophos TaxID=658473 RepID=A0ABQ0KXQ4_MYCCL|nr:predicted protein [Mycena chlorophos]
MVAERAVATGRAEDEHDEDEHDGLAPGCVVRKPVLSTTNDPQRALTSLLRRRCPSSLSSCRRLQRECQKTGKFSYPVARTPSDRRQQHPPQRHSNALRVPVFPSESSASRVSGVGASAHVHTTHRPASPSPRPPVAAAPYTSDVVCVARETILGRTTRLKTVPCRLSKKTPPSTVCCSRSRVQCSWIARHRGARVDPEGKRRRARRRCFSAPTTTTMYPILPTHHRCPLQNLLCLVLVRAAGCFGITGKVSRRRWRHRLGLSGMRRGTGRREKGATPEELCYDKAHIVPFQFAGRLYACPACPPSTTSTVSASFSTLSAPASLGLSVSAFRSCGCSTPSRVPSDGISGDVGNHAAW